MADGLAGFQRVVSHPAQSVGLVFVAVVGGGTTAEEESGEEQESEGGSGHAGSIWMAVRRVEGIFPQ